MLSWCSTTAGPLMRMSRRWARQGWPCASFLRAGGSFIRENMRQAHEASRMERGERSPWGRPSLCTPRGTLSLLEFILLPADFLFSLSQCLDLDWHLTVGQPSPLPGSSEALPPTSLRSKQHELSDCLSQKKKEREKKMLLFFSNGKTTTHNPTLAGAI